MGQHYYDGEYVIGALDALASKAGSIGYLVGLAVPDLIAGGNAYFAGACAVNPNIKLYEVTVGSFDDPAAVGMRRRR